MTPVDQTRFGAPHGNCWAACVASILGCDIDDVPPRVSENRYAFWWQDYLAWLRTRGLTMAIVEDEQFALDDVHRIASGMGPRGLRHAVVWRGGEVAHDPHPSREGLAEPPDRFYVFVPLDPARCQQ